jgi:hypothetical protein
MTVNTVAVDELSKAVNAIERSLEAVDFAARDIRRGAMPMAVPPRPRRFMATAH